MSDKKMTGWCHLLETAHGPLPAQGQRSKGDWNIQWASNTARLISSHMHKAEVRKQPHANLPND